MTEWFRVEVTDRDGQIVAIETEMLAGREIGDRERETINKAIDHLAGFVGRGYYASEDRDDASIVADTKRLDWLDRNLSKRLGWCVGVAPAGNVVVKSVVSLADKPSSIRDAIDAAMLAAAPAQEKQG